jgi:hypothetical protein
MKNASHQPAPTSKAGFPAENQPQKHLAVLAHQPRTLPPGFLDEKRLLSDKLPISRRTLFDWERQGKIPVVKINRRKLYHWASVEAALLRLQRGGEVE